MTLAHTVWWQHVLIVFAGWTLLSLAGFGVWVTLAELYRWRARRRERRELDELNAELELILREVARRAAFRADREAT